MNVLNLLGLLSFICSDFFTFFSLPMTTFLYVPAKEILKRQEKEVEMEKDSFIK